MTYLGGLTSMLIGYVRVSKSDGSRTLAPQREALLAASVGPERIYQDLASGRHDARPGLLACLKSLQPGNTLVLWKLNRLGRDLRHLVSTAEDLRGRGVGLKVLTGAGAQIDTTTASGRLGVTTTTLYTYVNGDGSPKAPGTAVLDGTARRGTLTVTTRGLAKT